jgi:hypothetical protein
MHKTIISDTSCFIILTNIGQPDLLQRVYGSPAQKLRPNRSKEWGKIEQRASSIKTGIKTTGYFQLFPGWRQAV